MNLLSLVRSPSGCRNGFASGCNGVVGIRDIPVLSGHARLRNAAMQHVNTNVCKGQFLGSMRTEYPDWFKEGFLESRVSM